MKKWANVLTALALAAALTACGSTAEDLSAESNATSADTEVTESFEDEKIESEESGHKESDYAETDNEYSDDKEEPEDISEDEEPVHTRVFALGKPFPDFTVETTDGTFTLSEAMEGKEAVLINFWATWCGYCTYEFPYIEEIYEKYDGKFGVVALSVDPADTLDVIGEYKEKQKLTFPMGQDESSLYSLLGERGVPVSVFIDRFGNVIYKQVGAFKSEEMLDALLEFMTSEEYTETIVLE